MPVANRGRRSHVAAMSDADPAVLAPDPAEPTMADDDAALTPLDPRFVSATRLAEALFWGPALVAAIVGEFLLPGWHGVFVVPALLGIALFVLRLPRRRYAARGYDHAADRLRVVSGILFRSDTVVPFGRVQHIDVDQGPIERMYDIATLTLHTAGSHNASVSLPGLAHEDAMAMRETIRAKIKRDAM